MSVPDGKRNEIRGNALSDMTLATPMAITLRCVTCRGSFSVPTKRRAAFLGRAQLAAEPPGRHRCIANIEKSAGTPRLVGRSTEVLASSAATVRE
jgi:hypothetical protein